MTEAKNFKCYKRLINKRLPKSQIRAVDCSLVIYRNVPRKFIELRKETPSVGAPPQIN